MLRSQIVGLLKASHFGPTALVVSMTFVLSLTQFSISDSAFVTLAIFFGQLFVGWTNDLIDFPRDKAALRLNKPLVAGTISLQTLKVCGFAALGGAVLISLLSPLRVNGSAIHFLGLLSATAYNLKLKATVLSVVPYIVSFGSLPWAIYAAAGSKPPIWLVLAFILFTCAFHFLNVLKDLDADIEQHVMGLPQVIGRTKSIYVAVVLASLGLLEVVLVIV
jgi:4-hydroxybenzoate polyprenyltransferase